MTATRSKAGRGRNSLASLAWRNLWRNRRRTLITLASIVFGFFLAILMTALQDRNWDDMINVAARLGGGHLSIEDPEFNESPTLKNAMGNISELMAEARSVEGVAAAVPRVLGQAMINTAHESYGAAFIAFDPALESAETLAILEAVELPEEFVRGENAILLGRKLAENLRAQQGDKIIYTMTDKNGEIVSGMARLRGMVETGAPSLDAGLALLPLDSLREAVGLSGDEASQIAVYIEDQRDAYDTALTLRQQMPEVAVLPWNEARPDLATFIAMKVGGALFMQLLVAVLVAAGIFNTLFVSVMERFREFGIMRAIGWSSGRLFRLVMLESLFLGLVGLVAGVLFTAGPYYLMSRKGFDISALLGDQTMEVAGVGMSSILRIGIFPENAVRIAVLALLAVLLSGIYPAWKAGRIEPVDAIKLV
jgi:ABC-type lipoprotein release transport system permease subunit